MLVIKEPLSSEDHLIKGSVSILKANRIFLLYFHIKRTGYIAYLTKIQTHEIYILLEILGLYFI